LGDRAGEGLSSSELFRQSATDDDSSERASAGLTWFEPVHVSPGIDAAAELKCCSAAKSGSRVELARTKVSNATLPQILMKAK
jgi:hypothetical protein